MSLFDFLKTELRARDWSMTDLARKAGCSKQIVSQWLAEDEAERIVPGTKSCQKLAAALGVDEDYVLALAGHRKPRPGEAQPDEAELSAQKFAGALRGVPRRFWATVLDASIALVNAYGDAPGARATGRPLNDQPSPASTLRSPGDTAHSKPKGSANRGKPGDDEELSKSQPAFRLGPRAVLVAL